MELLQFRTLLYLALLGLAQGHATPRQSTPLDSGETGAALDLPAKSSSIDLASPLPVSAGTDASHDKRFCIPSPDGCRADNNIPVLPRPVDVRAELREVEASPDLAALVLRGIINLDPPSKISPSGIHWFGQGLAKVAKETPTLKSFLLEVFSDIPSVMGNGVKHKFSRFYEWQIKKMHSLKAKAQNGFQETPEESAPLEEPTPPRSSWDEYERLYKMPKPKLPESVAKLATRLDDVPPETQPELRKAKLHELTELSKLVDTPAPDKLRDFLEQLAKEIQNELPGDAADIRSVKKLNDGRLGQEIIQQLADKAGSVNSKGKQPAPDIEPPPVDYISRQAKSLGLSPYHKTFYEIFMDGYTSPPQILKAVRTVLPEFLNEEAAWMQLTGQPIDVSTRAAKLKAFYNNKAVDWAQTLNRLGGADKLGGKTRIEIGKIKAMTVDVAETALQDVGRLQTSFIHTAADVIPEVEQLENAVDQTSRLIRGPGRGATGVLDFVGNALNSLNNVKTAAESLSGVLRDTTTAGLEAVEKAVESTQEFSKITLRAGHKIVKWLIPLPFGGISGALVGGLDDDHAPEHHAPEYDVPEHNATEYMEPEDADKALRFRVLLEEQAASPVSFLLKFQNNEPDVVDLVTREAHELSNEWNVPFADVYRVIGLNLQTRNDIQLRELTGRPVDVLVNEAELRQALEELSSLPNPAQASPPAVALSSTPVVVPAPVTPPVPAPNVPGSCTAVSFARPEHPAPEIPEVMLSRYCYKMKGSYYEESNDMVCTWPHNDLPLVDHSFSPPSNTYEAWCSDFGGIFKTSTDITQCRFDKPKLYHADPATFGSLTNSIGKWVVKRHIEPFMREFPTGTFDIITEWVTDMLLSLPAGDVPGNVVNMVKAVYKSSCHELGDSHAQDLRAQLADQMPRVCHVADSRTCPVDGGSTFVPPVLKM